MSLRVECLSVDARDPKALAQWWAGLLGWTIEEDVDDEEDLVAVRPPDGDASWGLTELLFVPVPEGKEIKNRLHLDLRPDDQDAEVERTEAMGARRVDIGQGEVSWVVFADPEGNEFCILRSLRPTSPRP